MENRGSSSPGEPLLFFCPIFLSIVIRQKNVLELEGLIQKMEHEFKDHSRNCDFVSHHQKI